MTDVSCPICKMNTYLNPDMKLYISPCYHRICATCLNRFYTHLEMKCFECNTMLRKSSYITQIFEDIDVERECKLRKLIYPHMLIEEHFDNLYAYYNYQEMVEDKILQLMEMNVGLNDESVCSLINEFKNEFQNAQQILEIKKMEKMEREKIEMEENVKVYDPYEDVNLECVKLKKKPVVPKWFKVNYLASGFTEHIIVYKSVYSLYDDKI